MHKYELCIDPCNGRHLRARHGAQTVVGLGGSHLREVGLIDGQSAWSQANGIAQGTAGCRTQCIRTVAGVLRTLGSAGVSDSAQLGAVTIQQPAERAQTIATRVGGAIVSFDNRVDRRSDHGRFTVNAVQARTQWVRDGRVVGGRLVAVVAEIS